MGAQIVHHDNVARVEGRDENLLDVSEESIAVHRAVDDAWGGERVCAQPRDKGRGFPVAMRDFTDQPFAARRPAAQSYHVGRGAGFVDEDQALGIELRLIFNPSRPRFGDVRPILLRGAKAFF